MHIAAALGVKTLSFFPPDSVLPMRALRWGPLGNKSEIIKPAEGAKDMEGINVDEVLEKLKALLEQ
jgi:ADP-heptose:LPS heptosyltransferase